MDTMNTMDTMDTMDYTGRIILYKHLPLICDLCDIVFEYQKNRQCLECKVCLPMHSKQTVCIDCKQKRIKHLYMNDSISMGDFFRMIRGIFPD